MLVAIKDREFQQPPCRAGGLVKKLLQVFHGIICQIEREMEKKKTRFFEMLMTSS